VGCGTLRGAAAAYPRAVMRRVASDESGVRVLCRVKAQRLVVNARAALCWRVCGFVRQGARGGDARQGALALPHPQAA
jgi:hypothetical protein